MYYITTEMTELDLTLTAPPELSTFAARPRLQAGRLMWFLQLQRGRSLSEVIHGKSVHEINGYQLSVLTR
jgi:hypothetical protein